MSSPGVPGNRHAYCNGCSDLTASIKSSHLVAVGGRGEGSLPQGSIAEQTLSAALQWLYSGSSAMSASVLDCKLGTVVQLDRPRLGHAIRPDGAASVLRKR